MVDKKLDCGVGLAKIISKTSINKITIEEHIVRLVHSIGYYATAGEVLLVMVVVDAPHELITNAILNGEGV
jgi:hypothetical protein